MEVLRALIITLIIFPFGLFAQSKIDFSQRVKAQSKSKYHDVVVNFELPNTLEGRQKLLDFQFSCTPDIGVYEGEKYFVEYEGNTLAKEKEIVVTSTLILYRNDLYTAKRRKIPIDISSDLGPYLLAEDNLQIDNRVIRQKALELQGESQEITVKNIFNFVVGHLEYHRFNTQNRSALEAYKQQKGDCTEYTELMIALCRANRIPARYVVGFVAQTRTNARHNWVEVYFDEYGWVAFDPTFADSTTGNTTFEKMENLYVYMSFQRNSFRSTLNFAGYQAKVGFEFVTKYYVAEGIKEAKKLVNTKNWDEVIKVCDSLLTEGFKDYQLHALKGKAYLNKGVMDEALLNMQKALKLAYFDKDEGEVLFLFFSYFTKIDKPELAIPYLKRTLELGHRLNTEEMKSVLFDDQYLPIRSQEGYNEISEKLFARYSKYTFDYTENVLEGFAPIELIDPDCQSSSWHGWLFYPEGLNKDLILSARVKCVNLKGEHFISRYNIDTLGRLSSSAFESDYAENLMNCEYSSESNKLTKLISFNIQDGDTTQSSKLYHYADECLKKIEEIGDRNSSDGPVKVLDVEHVGDNSVVLKTKDYHRKYELEKTYYFDDGNRIVSCDITSKYDTVRLSWQYDDPNYVINRTKDGEFQSKVKRNSKRQIIEKSNVYNSSKYTYDSNGRLSKKITTFQKFYNSSKTIFKYEYYPSGLPKAIFMKRNRREKFTMHMNYTYEFYDL